MKKYTGNIQNLIQGKLKTIMAQRPSKMKIASSQRMVEKAKLIPMLQINEELLEESIEFDNTKMIQLDHDDIEIGVKTKIIKIDEEKIAK